MVGTTSIASAVAVAVGMGDTTDVGAAVSGGSVAGSGVDVGMGDTTGVGAAVSGGSVAGSGVNDGDGDGAGKIVGSTVAGDDVGVAMGATVGDAIAGDGSNVAEGNTVSGDTVTGIEGVSVMGGTVGDGSEGSVGAATGAGSVARPAGIAVIGNVETASGTGRIPPKRTTRMVTPVRNASAARINCTLGRRGGSGSIQYLSANTIWHGLYRASHTDVNALWRIHRGALFAECE
jgi:hypothetical protein